MSVSFCHASAPLVPQYFGDFTEMVKKGEVSTSSNTVAQIEHSLGWRFERESEGGCFLGEISVPELQQFIEKCDIVIENCDIALNDSRCIVMQRITQLRKLAKQALHFGEPVMYS